MHSVKYMLGFIQFGWRVITYIGIEGDDQLYDAQSLALVGVYMIRMVGNMHKVFTITCMVHSITLVFLIDLYLCINDNFLNGFMTFEYRLNCIQII